MKEVKRISISFFRRMDPPFIIDYFKERQNKLLTGFLNYQT